MSKISKLYPKISFDLDGARIVTYKEGYYSILEPDGRKFMRGLDKFPSYDWENAVFTDVDALEI